MSRLLLSLALLGAVVCLAPSAVLAARDTALTDQLPAAAVGPATAATAAAARLKAGAAGAGGDNRPRGTECEDLKFRKSLLTYIKEVPFIGLFEDVLGSTRFEASGMTIAKDHMWIVFDNLHALGRVKEQFEFRDPDNKLVVEDEHEQDSQFEGITYIESSGHFYTVEEVAEHEGRLHPFVHELEVSRDLASFRTIARCPVHYVLEHENKGFEGLHYHEAGDTRLLLGLCEGNFCAGGEESRTPGNGRIIVSRFNGAAGEDCGWDVVKEVKVPPSARFVDYSGMAFRGNQVAIVSQESSALWVGEFDFDSLEFVGDGRMYHFPRNNHCEVVYCTVEGVQWIDDVRLAIASDKTKSNQPFRCLEHDQRVSIFALPSRKQQ